MKFINLDAFADEPLERQPFEHVVVPNFIRRETIREIMAAFPGIEHGGSFPLSRLRFGAAFAEFCDELRSETVRDHFAEKFDLDLSHRPTTLTVRGRCRLKDGKIHVDSKSKLITVLIYMNAIGGDGGGRLRLLRSPSMEDCAKEVAPVAGRLLCFRNGPTAWHGHLPFDGQRRVIQLNWVTSESVVRHSERRHGLSAIFKRLNPLGQAARNVPQSSPLAPVTPASVAST